MYQMDLCGSIVCFVCIILFNGVKVVSRLSVFNSQMTTLELNANITKDGTTYGGVNNALKGRSRQAG